MQEPVIQLDSDFEPSTCCKGARMLFCEVIKVALRDCIGATLAGSDTPKEVLKQRAMAWVFHPYKGVGSFSWYCMLTDVDADLVRDILKKPGSKAYQRLVSNLKSTLGVYARKPRVKDAA